MLKVLAVWPKSHDEPVTWFRETCSNSADKVFTAFLTTVVPKLWYVKAFTVVHE